MGWGTLFLDDAFTDTNGTDLEDHDADWVWWDLGYTDICEIQSNYCVNDAGAGYTAIWYEWQGTPASANYAVGAQIYFASVGVKSYPHVDARTTGSGGYRFYYDQPNDLWVLIETDWYTENTIDSADASAHSNQGETHEMLLLCEGTSIKGYVDGVEVCSATDSNHSAAGKAAIAYYDQATTAIGQIFDSVKAGVWTPANVPVVAHHHRMLQGVG